MRVRRPCNAYLYRAVVSTLLFCLAVRRCFDTGIVRSISMFEDHGMLSQPVFVSFVMGVASGMPADPEWLPLLIKLLWVLCCNLLLALEVCELHHCARVLLYSLQEADDELASHCDRA